MLEPPAPSGGTLETLAPRELAQNCVLHRCLYYPGQNQLQTVNEELFQAYDCDVEGSIVYK
jgi:hypothetical protein